MLKTNLENSLSLSPFISYHLIALLISIAAQNISSLVDGGSELFCNSSSRSMSFNLYKYYKSVIVSFFSNKKKIVFFYCTCCTNYFVQNNYFNNFFFRILNIKRYWRKINNNNKRNFSVVPIHLSIVWSLNHDNFVIYL